VPGAEPDVLVLPPTPDVVVPLPVPAGEPDVVVLLPVPAGEPGPVPGAGDDPGAGVGAAGPGRTGEVSPVTVPVTPDTIRRAGGGSAPATGPVTIPVTVPVTEPTVVPAPLSVL
jgi:hypothetical protein